MKSLPSSLPSPSVRPPQRIFTWFRNHFDLAWRRGWQRDTSLQGLTFASYSRLQRRIIEKYLELSGRGATFEIEQTLSVRDAVRHQPELLSLLKEAARRGHFRMVGCGETIIDINQCHGETMVRNLVSGTLYTRNVLRHQPTVAGRFDGFGASAQYPQIARECGYRWVTGFSYSKPDKPYWRGLDGSTVFTASEDDFPGDFHFYDHCYYEPCPHCGGIGHRPTQDDCPSCQGSGLDLAMGTYPPRQDPAEPRTPFAIYFVRSEEMQPDPSLLDQVARFNSRRPRVPIEWGTLESLVPYFQEALDAVDTPPRDQIASACEWNPTQTGTLVSRARLKQLAREAERTYYACERYFACRAFSGHTPPAEALEDLWLQLPLLYFHDVITGTLSDEAATEMEAVARNTSTRARALAAHSLFSSASGSSTWSVFNPDASGFPVEVKLPDSTEKALRPQGKKTGAIYFHIRSEAFQIPMLKALHASSKIRPASSKRLTLVEPPRLNLHPLREEKKAPSCRPLPASTTSARNAFFEIAWDEHGLTAIRNRQGKTISAAKKNQRPNTLLLEEDIGDPWGTRSFQRERIDIYHNTRLVGAWRGDGFVEICFAGIFQENLAFAREKDPSVFGLEWTQTVRLIDHSPRIDFVTEIYWKSANRRIRVAFPTASASDDAWYGIPCGYLKRKRYEMKDVRLYSPNGDWPALDFLALLPAKNPGLALFNRGTVSARVESGTVLLSLMRSPAFGSCLERYAQDYPVSHAGAKDPGYHCFEYALTSFHREEEIPTVAAHAQAYNAFPLLVNSAAALPTLTVAPVEIDLLSLKPAFDGNGIILRLLNKSPRPIDAKIQLPPTVKAANRCTLLEEPLEPFALVDGSISLAMAPWKIVSLRLQSKVALEAISP